ncbi:MAG: co-chaperone GroES [Erysipelotrichaceae bacterium]|jgi:chaperonin GroES|nr:co-chaperone GroES [Bacillota bacterium]NLP21508.1 co-chaperone GroES [Erysipelotrichaceae bacterium]HCY06028.1 co-chaperone GroES [Erysipelotrichaceae bacterium]
MLKPLRDNVVIEKSKEEVKTASGIVLSDKPKDEPSIGIVLEVGPGKEVDGKLVSMNIEKGQKVVYKRYGGTEVKLDEKEYLIISVDDILAIIE